jgi:hypothetical protein
VTKQQVLAFRTYICSLKKKNGESLLYYKEYEANADQSIRLLESDTSELQAELKVLAKQNADLLIANSQLVGKVAAYEATLPNTQ